VEEEVSFERLQPLLPGRLRAAARTEPLFPIVHLWQAAVYCLVGNEGCWVSFPSLQGDPRDAEGQRKDDRTLCPMGMEEESVGEPRT
jgi:hypothetical protein